MPTKQRCKICGTLKVLAEYEPALKVKGVQRYKHTCLECMNIKKAKQFTKDVKVVEVIHAAPTIDTMDQEDYREGYKMCNKCGEEKPIDAFFKDRVSNGRQTYRSDCKLCAQEAAKTRIARYKSKKRNLVDTLTDEQWTAALEHFNHRCAYCIDGAAECQEHCTPVDKGGSYSASNIVPACLKCNSSKGARHLKFWWKQQTFFTPEALAKVENWLQAQLLLENQEFEEN